MQAKPDSGPLAPPFCWARLGQVEEAGEERVTVSLLHRQLAHVYVPPRAPLVCEFGVRDFSWNKLSLESLVMLTRKKTPCKLWPWEWEQTFWATTR